MQILAEGAPHRHFVRTDALPLHVRSLDETLAAERRAFAESVDVYAVCNEAPHICDEEKQRRPLREQRSATLADVHTLLIERFKVANAERRTRLIM